MGGRTSQVIPDVPVQENVGKETSVSIKTGNSEKNTNMPEFYQVPETIEPSVQLPLKDVQVFEGKTVRLDCVIIGQPEPEVSIYIFFFFIIRIKIKLILTRNKSRSFGIMIINQ